MPNAPLRLISRLVGFEAMLFARPFLNLSTEHPRRHFVLPAEAPPLCRKRDVTRPGERCLHNLSYHIVLLTLY